MTPTDKVFLGSRAFLLNDRPWEHLVPKGFLFVQENIASEESAMPRILVALDDSCGSEKALEAAVNLAQQHDGQVTAVTVLEDVGNPSLDQRAEDVRVQTRRRLEELLETAGNFARSRGVRLTPILREGQAADAIITCAEEEKANLLVLGASRMPNDNSGLGDTADQVSNHCSCTVLIAR
jgi:nucleotide-binding universal stress UspA family protein